MLEESQALTVSLGGLSKSVGLPQLKPGVDGGGWAGVSIVPAETMQRLEIIADTDPSAATPVQVAAARLLELGAQVREQIADRLSC